ncbi:MAG: FkbM family methyltransferase [Deltaproteobacteria bacterium]|nr:MAG: FkbM family methyltransferase [Deltaproteobacteria bacterium]
MNSNLPSYSQFREDKILDRIFFDKKGTCVEVGANDGITGSTTYFFEKKGWKCVLIEPVPDLCERIRRFRSALVFECAASSESGEGVFYVAESTKSLSTLSPTESLQKEIAANKTTLREIHVRKRTLDEILEEAGIRGIDFITIDVEGHEMDVLIGFSIEKYRPRIIIIEDNDDHADDSIGKYLGGKGYRAFFRTGVNDWYASDSDIITNINSIAQLEREKKLYEYEDKITSKFSFLNNILPDSIKRILITILHKFIKCVN